MISVTYCRNDNEVVVEGHANSGEKGHDLICASVSILCDPHFTLKSSVTLVFDSICAGFELLAKNYPDNISYEIV